MIYQNYLVIEASIKGFLNNPENAGLFSGSPRTVGDRVEEAIKEHISEFIPGISNFDQKFARRSMEDLSFEDNDGNYYAVDVKTHNLDTAFNMPNLTSVQRIAKLYRGAENHFCLLKIDYSQNNAEPVTGVHFLPIEHLDWACLTLGALGWGQIQIANANKVLDDRTQTRKSWMLKLCDALEVFYPAEIKKIALRRNFFAEERQFWELQADSINQP
jgi:hypothetical protein